MESKRKTILMVVMSILLISVIGVFFVLWNPQPRPSVPMPVPNGYSEFMQAGKLVQEQTSHSETMDETPLRSLVEANSNALQVARSGFREQSRVPLQFSEPYVSNHIYDAIQIRLLARAFAAEGRLAEMEQRTNDAARAYLDVVQLGIKSRNGGTLIDSVFGSAVQNLGTTRLHNIAPSLDDTTAVELAKTLENLGADAESWEQVRDHEKDWSRRAYPGLQYWVTALFMRTQIQSNEKKAKKGFMEHESSTRRLILDLATHAYQLEKGHRPTGMPDLVPAYLKAAPIDPLTEKEMTLSP